ncbi:uncharacterized protein MYCFIDRAFT_192938 [Pseudocercospora fijiensis CIRAD86]|uniref:Uncharacterized protein n=1 Tax=Pseudocercospora fijiensis (strain CIRAD86) TaxID=383855 RepID=N1QAI3_PSEFD|nr:uncharacterized protein MYCFIDRAFT_192938 [Pseudocercospora fijiensis CIRAD86]EME88881.1 hypothetical protein MYCFIDRAFT_192938 [Pseudocercospora fijiensis CIRAD86]
MAVNTGTLPPHLRKAAMKNAEAPKPASDSVSATNAAPDVASPDGNAPSNEERAVIPFGKAQRTTRGDRSSIKDSYARLEENFRAANAALANDNDELHERCDELEIENETLTTQCQELTDKNVELVRRCEDFERDNAKCGLHVDSLVEENKQLLAEVQDLKQKMLENEQHLEEFQRLAAVNPTKSSVKQEPNSTWHATAAKPNVTQLSKEQLNEVLGQLHVSYADVQRQAEEAASIRYKGVMDAQVAMQDKLERRILAMETRNDRAGDANEGFQVESTPAETIRLLQADLDALKTTIAIMQPQCNQTTDNFDTMVNRVAAIELQTQEMVESKQGSTYTMPSAPHAADTDYQTKTKLRQLKEEVTKLKGFKDRIKNIRDHEQAISEAQNVEGLVEQYKKVSKAIDSNGW